MRIHGSIASLLSKIEYLGKEEKMLLGKPILGCGREQIGIINEIIGDTWYGEISDDFVANRILQNTLTVCCSNPQDTKAELMEIEQTVDRKIYRMQIDV